MAELIPEGTYRAKVVFYGMRTTQAGKLEPAIVFNATDNDGRIHRVFWRSSLNEGTARTNTIKSLFACGYPPDKISKIASFADGPDSGLLDMKQDVEVVIIHEADKENPSKIYPRVQWVNDLKALKFQNAIDKQETMRLLQGMNLEADMMKFVKDNGVKRDDSRSKDSVFDRVPQVSEADIPF